MFNTLKLKTYRKSKIGWHKIMKCKKDISFLVIVILKMHFKKENQMWLKFGWVIELKNFTVPGYFFISYFLYITVIIIIFFK
jgi:hypothetical protein